MRVREVPLLEDNYGYLLIDEATGSAAAIDPAEPHKMLAAAQAEGVDIVMVLTTHKHWDHAGGNSEMAKLLSPPPSQRGPVPIIGGQVDSVEACTQAVQDGDTLTLGHDTLIRCLHTPGHTMGHMCYYVTSSSTTSEGGSGGAVFTGDTLFVGGAGKFFEGSPEDMLASLHAKLGTLPHTTQVYCGHEYTLSNYRFALWLEPSNQALAKENQWASQRRQAGLPTVPSTLAKEWATNPFLRTRETTVRVRVAAEGRKEEASLSDAEVLGLVRELKNNFKG